jgi:hypothetical protein
MATKKQRLVKIEVVVNGAELRDLKRLIGTKGDVETIQQVIDDRLSAERIFEAVEQIRKRGTWVDTYGRTTKCAKSPRSKA